MAASGIHIAFFDAGEAANKELPAIGPLDGVLLRGDRLVVDHADVAVPDEPGIAVTRWFEGVVELQRATGEAPGGRRRASMRVSAPDGLYLRFGSVGEPAASLRELGPFALVFIGARTIEANGDVLASRVSPGGGMWTLTVNADANVGAQRPDVGFRAASQAYHPWMAAVQAPPPQAAATAPTVAPAAAPTPSVFKDSEIDLLERRARRAKEEEARAEERARQIDAALAEADARATARDREAAAAREAATAREAASARDAATARAAAAARQAAEARQAAAARETPPAREARTLRETVNTRGSAGAAQRKPAKESATSRRIAAALSSTPESQPAARDAGDWLELAWRLRFVLVAVLVAVLGVAVFNATQQGSSTARPQERTFNLGQKITGTRWDYVINGMTREPVAGTVRARGVYVVVRLTVTNKGAESTQAFPSDVAIIDAAGNRYASESLQSGVYASADNRSPFEWPTTYPPGRAVSTRVLFDVDASLRGLQLIITELPGTKVRLE